ncbi:MAG: 3D-(3,5/4)-trihydroxycyclohexane-1,2-dione acylhydrolase (decyclizing) [Verrucomicrobiales bacterium]|nr:3D-(3,5/4)-trihydroxycyclohexane-1,2-dione acylhydrolase (decyclizing) [Verrucomicrobiales bacterium]
MNQRTERLTMAQALVKFLIQQQVERDGATQPFFAGCFGIFGHGIVSGIGQALQQYPALRYYQSRNEQAMVHTAVAYAKMKNRLQTLVCTSSIGPGATNMITGAAVATINRLPVLLLPGDIFARRNVAPVLQQLESEHSQDISVNDCFKPVSRYWDRIYRPDQLITALPEVMRVLTSPAETGAVTLAVPQDAQTEAYDYPVELFQRRVWSIPRNRPDRDAVGRAAEWIRQAKRPLIVAGGGVIYSEATEVLKRFVEAHGIPVGETMAGKGSLRFDHPLNLGAIGVTGTSAANRAAKSADLVIGIGTRYSDFTTMSKTAFQDPGVRFVNLNVTAFDAFKHHALPLVGDARVTLEELLELLKGYAVPAAYRAECEQLHREWEAEVDRIYAIRHQPLPSQGELIGVVNEMSSPDAVMINAAGSMPGDLHKLWRTRHSKNFHMEYGYSCMGYEIAGGLGIKMADPKRDVYVMVGDGSYLMLGNEIVTSIQENQKLIIVLMDNSGFNSIGGLSRSLGQQGFGTRYVYPKDGKLLGDDAGAAAENLPVDLAMNARGLGAHVIECRTRDEFIAGLKEAQAQTRTTVVYIRNDRYAGVGGYDSWWDVPPAEVSEMDSVRKAREAWAAQRPKERFFL